MMASRLPFVLLLSLVLLSLNLVNAQIVSNISWNTNTYYQGNSGIVNIALYNNHHYTICTKQFYVHFDWEPTGYAFVSSDTPCIASGYSYTFIIPFSIPSNASVGVHMFNVTWVDQGYLLGTVPVYSGNLYIHSYYEKMYLTLILEVQSGISQEQMANYQNPVAQSYLSQAISYDNQAQTLSEQGQYQVAIIDLNQSLSLLSDASSAEASYQPSFNNFVASSPTIFITSTGILILIIIIIIIVVSIIVAIYISRKKHKTPQKTTSNYNDRKEEENEYFKIIKERYAKGEITESQFREIKKNLEK